MTIRLIGQVKSGKNHLMITASGHRYPLKAWADWRDYAVMAAKHQAQGRRFEVPVVATFYLWCQDKRRRDIPGLEDAIYHVLERSGILKDDSLVVEQHTFKVYAPDKPGASIELKEVA